MLLRTLSARNIHMGNEYSLGIVLLLPDRVWTLLVFLESQSGCLFCSSLSEKGRSKTIVGIVTLPDIGFISLLMTGSLFLTDPAREDAFDDGVEESSEEDFLGGFGHAFSLCGVWNLFGATLCANFLQ
ncbi:hypothetical protein SCUP234_00129 [Seiridium cupressi]